MEKSLRAAFDSATSPIQSAVEQFATVRAQLALASQWIEQVRALQQSAALQGVLNSLGETRSFVEGLTRNWETSAVAEAIKQLEAQNKALFDIDWDRLWDQDEATLTFASDNGWFVQPENDFDLASTIEGCDGDIEQLDALFVDSIGNVMQDIHKRVAAQFPGRRHLIDEAFKLYGEERYIGAVPLMLMVADGIAHGTAGKSAYNSKGRQTTLGAWVADLEVGRAIRPHAAQLANRHQLSRSGHRGLSRHGVLHGTDPDYGTRVNCLKAASFLGFIAWLMAEKEPIDSQTDDAVSDGRRELVPPKPMPDDA